MAGSKTGLDKTQAGRGSRAREVLAQEHGTDAHSLAARIGQLEWWLADMLSLVDQVTGQDG